MWRNGTNKHRKRWFNLIMFNFFCNFFVCNRAEQFAVAACFYFDHNNFFIQLFFHFLSFFQFFLCHRAADLLTVLDIRVPKLYTANKTKTGSVQRHAVAADLEPLFGLIFIPNYQLDILEEENQTKYKVYIRETTSYFVYNKEHSDKNQYIKGRTLIRQLTNDSRVIPYRRPTVERLQEKISEINLLIELTETDKKYQDIKDELVAEIAELDIKLTQTNEKIATLNKMAEVLINLKNEDASNRKLARYDFSKLNLTESTSLEHVSEEIWRLQEKLDRYLDEYESLVRRLETFVKIFNNNKNMYQKFQENVSVE